ncbi:MAG: hypothetical protein A2054_10535 [Deltaproteobacteria bacterium GWA2_55_10]|nr:MAG: hypothetical protein A2054_10535 [Deltaproteobacteria bacterium GWA2_55_10]
MKLKVFINGKILPEDKACVSVFDRGLSYGDGIYETMKARDGQPLFLNEHLKRLRTGGRFLGLTGIKGFEDMIRGGALQKLLNANGLGRGEAYVKLLVTRGTDKAGHLPAKGISPTLIIIAKPIDTALIRGIQEKGVSAVFVDDVLPALPGVKSLNYLPSVLARMKANRRRAFEAIFVKDGFVEEGSSSNVFIVKGGRLLTPPLSGTPSEGVLAGVTRAAVMIASKKNGITVRETRLRPKDLYRADEAFITNSIMDAVPLVAIEGKKVGGGRPGMLTRLMQELLK